LPSQKTTTRWRVVAPKAAIFTLSLIGQSIACVLSIFSESFSESQNKPGALLGSGFSGTGAIQTDPDPGSAEKAEFTRTTIKKTSPVVRILVSQEDYRRKEAIWLVPDNSAERRSDGLRQINGIVGSRLARAATHHRSRTDRRPLGSSDRGRRPQGSLKNPMPTCSKCASPVSACRNPSSRITTKLVRSVNETRGLS
jgi:hypothetical protein